MPKNQKSSKADKSAFPIVPITIIPVVSTIIYFLLLSFFALYSLKTSANRSLYLPFAIILSALSGFICGFAVARITKINGMFYGGLSGLIYSLLSSIIIFTINKGTAGNGIFILIAASVIAASLGGVSAVNIRKKIRY